MPVIMESMVRDLPSPVAQVVNEFADAAVNAFGQDLRSIVLYGSGAEGKLRAASDVNLILVLSVFDQSKADRLCAPLRTAQAAIRLAAMFLLESEISSAVEAFPVKFYDILHRHRVLYGNDPFSSLSIPQRASIVRLKQVLLNLKLRLRASYVLRGLREEQLALMVADAAGPLRSCAFTLLNWKANRPHRLEKPYNVSCPVFLSRVGMTCLSVSRRHERTARSRLERRDQFFSV